MNYEIYISKEFERSINVYIIRSYRTLISYKNGKKIDKTK